ncbi:MAG TPA: CpsD/CapB family tyrosine-protein kinase [Thermomicrobiales bacterium]|jgi:Mrp family chromosome partitioning ATPase|nr:CpsD/CapB family tyrosine-protein kinase [Thermomicrobiales bacterium]
MEFDLARLLRLARRWGIVVVLLAILGGVAGYALSTTRPVEYASSATLLVTANQSLFGTDVNSGLQTQAETFRYEIQTESFLSEAADALGLPPVTGVADLRAATTVVSNLSPPRVVITVTGTDPDQTTRWVNGIAGTYVGYVAERDAALPPEESSWAGLRFSEPAIEPGAVVAPSRPMWVLLGAILAGLLAVTVVLAIEQLRAAGSGLRRPGALPVLAVLETIRSRTRGGAPLVDVNSGTDAARGVVQLRSAVQVLTATQGMRTLAISSLRPGEGKSTVAANLAVALAQSGDRVILIDANLDAPHLGEIFGGGARAGLSSLMADPGMDLADAVSGTNWPNLMFIPAGPRQDASRLDRSAFRRVLSGIVPHADLVIYEAPALAEQSDRLRLAGMADGALLVVGGERTRIEALRAISNQKVANVTNVVGVVIDRGVGVVHDPGPAPEPGTQFQPALTLITRKSAQATNGPASPDQPLTASQTASPANGATAESGTGSSSGRASVGGDGEVAAQAESTGGLVRTARAVPIGDPETAPSSQNAAVAADGNSARNVSA